MQLVTLRGSGKARQLTRHSVSMAFLRVGAIIRLPLRRSSASQSTSLSDSLLFICLDQSPT